MRKLMAVLVIAGFGAACNGARDGDDVLQQDTVIQTLPAEDTVMIERTVIEDTLQAPDRLQNDTLRDRRDTVPR